MPRQRDESRRLPRRTKGVAAKVYSVNMSRLKEAIEGIDAELQPLRDAVMAWEATQEGNKEEAKDYGFPADASQRYM